MVIYALFLISHTFFHVINILKGAEIKMRKNKGPTLLQGAGPYITKLTKPDFE